MKSDATDREYLVHLGKKIREKRKAKDLSQLALAGLCNIEKANVSRLEGGKLNPTVLTLRKVAVVLFGGLPEMLGDGRDNAS